MLVQVPHKALEPESLRPSARVRDAGPIVVTGAELADKDGGLESPLRLQQIAPQPVPPSCQRGIGGSWVEPVGLPHLRTVLMDRVHQLAGAGKVNRVVLNTLEIASPQPSLDLAGLWIQVELCPFHDDEETGVDAQKSI